MKSRFLKSPHFAALSEPDLEAFLGAGTNWSLRTGDRIFERGEPGDSLYVVLDGEVEIEFDEPRPPKRLSAGAVFGELALLVPGHRRTASAVATSDALVCIFGPQAMAGLTRQRPQTVVSFLQRACAYLIESEQKLTRALKQKNRELETILDYLHRTFEELSYQELLARTDELTGLYNRRCLASQLGKLVERSQATGVGLALITVDLDGLKRLNDTHGHAGGDQALRHVGKVIRDCVRKSDLPCRVGGDEFSVLLVDITDDQARTRAKEVRRAISTSPVRLDRLEIAVTASLGGTMYRAGETPESFLKRADHHLYEAKKRGGNCVSWQGGIIDPTPGPTGQGS